MLYAVYMAYPEMNCKYIAGRASISMCEGAMRLEGEIEDLL